MEIKPYQNNAKKHPDKQLKQIAASLRQFGWQQPIKVGNGGIILVGHGRYLAYSKYPDGIKDPWIINEKGETISGEPEKRVLTEEEEKAYRLADNKLNESEWDMELVIPELKDLSLDMVDLTGFDRDLLIESSDRDDEVPTEAPPVAKLGNLWALGRHRLLCGDATKEEDVARLMGGVLAKLIFTSPPYNMGGGMYETYEDNLKKEEYINFNIQVLSNFQKYLRGFVFWNISYNKNAKDSFIEIIYRIIKETGLRFLELIVWNKKHAMPITSKEAMTRQYEDIFLMGDEENIQKDLELFFCGRNDKRAWFNKKTQKGITNYWEVGTNKTQLENHLACYPVALPVKGILLMTDNNDVVIDPFGGSGSTLIACEKTNRICYMMELDEKYVDVIIKRWEEYTGNKAKKIK